MLKHSHLSLATRSLAEETGWKALVPTKMVKEGPGLGRGRGGRGTASAALTGHAGRGRDPTVGVWAASAVSFLATAGHLGRGQGSPAGKMPRGLPVPLLRAGPAQVLKSPSARDLEPPREARAPPGA